MIDSKTDKLNTAELLALRVKAKALAAQRDDLQEKLQPLISETKRAYYNLWIAESEELRKQIKRNIQWDDLSWPCESSGSVGGQNAYITDKICLVCDKALGISGYYSGSQKGHRWSSPLEDYMNPTLYVHRQCMPSYIKQRLDDGF